MPSRQAHLTSIEKAVEEARIRTHVPGCALAIVRDDRVVLAKGFGERDVEQHLPVTGRTLFNIGSCSKAFTGVLALMSEDRGMLSLDDSPRKYLPYFHLRDSEADANVTLRDLLNHYSGLGEHAGDMIWSSGLFTREETIRAMAAAHPTARLGERCQYNNVLHTAAGEAIARAWGMGYEHLLEEALLRPLGMTSTSSNLPFLQNDPDFSLGYSWDVATGKYKLTLPNPAAVEAVGPAGGITSNAQDMAQWLRLILSGGVFQGNRLLSDAHFAEILQRSEGPNLGWVCSEWNDNPEFWNVGSHTGYWAEVHVLPEQRLGFAILTNVGYYANPRPSLPVLARDAIYSELVSKPIRSAVSPRSDILAESTPAPSVYCSPISVPDLMAKVIDAAGGEARVRKHTSMRATCSVTLENQGVTGECLLYRRSPDRSSLRITLCALGKPLGSIHEYFDGAQGGCDATPSISWFNIGPLSGASLDNIRTSAAFPDLVDWQTRFREVSVIRMDTVAGEEVYVVQKVPERGDPVTDYVSARSFLLLRRDDPNSGKTLYSDYRAVGGVLMPYRWVLQLAGEMVGDWVFSVQEILFDLPVQEDEFQWNAL